MITFEYIQELSKLDKIELGKRIDEMPEKDAKDLLYGILCSMFRHDRATADEIAKL